MELNNKHLNQHGRFNGTFLVLFFVISAVLLSGCVSTGKKIDALAYIDSEPITREDLSYSLSVEHRREDLSNAKELNIRNYLNKLINERLVIQEARRMEMQEYPAVKDKINEYILRESVVILHEDEILNKISVSDDDIKKYYKDNYKVFKLDIYGLNSKDNALKLKDMILQGSDISKVSKEDAGIKRIDEGKEFNYKALARSMQDAVSVISPGEYSDIVEVKGVYYIIKLLGVEDAPDDKFASVRDHIVKSLTDLKEEERSKQYLGELRQKTPLIIDNDILLSLKIGAGDNERDKLSRDSRILVTINGEILTVKDFIALLPPVVKITNEQILDNWINRKLVDIEALRRRYDLQPKLAQMVRRYENQVLQNTYVNEVILPSIEVSEQKLNEYFEMHKNDYVVPAQYKMQAIAVEKMDEASDIYNSLVKGADFAWLAKLRSKDQVSAENGGSIGWLSIDRMPLPLKEIIDTLKPGDISPILEIDSHYNIFRLQQKTEPQVKDFSAVKPDIYRAFMAEQFNIINNNNLEKLRADTEITINEDALKVFEKGFK